MQLVRRNNNALSSQRAGRRWGLVKKAIPVAKYLGKKAYSYAKNSKKRKYDGNSGSSGRASYVAAAQYSAKTKIGKKRVDFKKKKVVRVSRPLRAKINKVIDGTMPSGFYQKISTQRIGLNDNQQNVGMVPNKYSVDLLTGSHFSPTQILDAASILWNNKGATSTITVTDARNFNNETCQIDILKCWSIIKMRNNSQRLFNVCIYTFDPKTSLSSGNTPLNVWAGELTNNIQSGTGQNVSSISINTLYNNPKMLAGIRTQYDISKDYYEVFPGQEKNFTINGPQNIRLDMAKTYRGSLYQNQDKKFTRFCMITVHGDLSGSTAVPVTNEFVGRPTQPNVVGGYGLLIETNEYYSLKQPNQAGFYNLAAVPTNSAIPLEMRRPAYSINNTSETILPANDSTVLENNPVPVAPV